MNRGLLYISFGRECDRLAANTITYSRQFTDLPVCVVTNIKHRVDKWKAVSDVTFINVKDSVENNRDYKTRMNEFTPFDETLYLDCDSVIQNFGIEEAFSQLADGDLVLNSLLHWETGQKIIRLYKTAMSNAGTKLPLTVYNGALIGFKKNDRVDKFFTIWNNFWVKNGKGREMPALACAIKSSQAKVNNLKKGFFSPDYYNHSCVVQHNYNKVEGCKDFFSRFNVPLVKLFKNFDGDTSDWNWVEL